MSSRSAPRGSERRRAPRAQTRLHGRIVRGRERIRVRVVDVSEGGVCLLCPVWLDPKKSFPLEVDVPGRGVSLARVEVWHIRREKSPASNNKIWVVGALLAEADGTFAELLAAVGLASRPALMPTPNPPSTPGPGPAPIRATVPASPPASARAPVAPAPLAQAPSRKASPRSAVDAAIDSVEPRIFRLRCKAKGSPRTRLLSITAESEAEALTLARQDLGADWNVLEALEA